MKKRIPALLLALVMTCSTLPMSAMAQDISFAASREAVTDDSVGPLSLAGVAEDSDTAQVDTLSEDNAQDDVNVTAEEVDNDANTVGLDVDGESPAKTQEPEADDLVTFVVNLKQDSLLDAGFSVEEISEGTSEVESYREEQEAVLDDFIDELTAAYGDEEGFSIGYTYTATTTGLSVTTAYGNKSEIAQMPQVSLVYVAPMFQVPEDQESLSPMTTNATTMIGSNILNESGYTGKGMRIAILDTGIYMDSPNFAPLSDDQLDDPLTVAELQSVWNDLNASQGNGNPALTYRNTKIPFAYNYNDGNLDASHNGTGSDHGTHVAGIAAANKIESGTGSDVVGVAPEAQLLVMKVFGGDGAGWDVVMAGLEDCVYLDVDAANLSLGSAAGFTDADADMTAILTALEEAGVQVVIASGNDTNSALQNLHGYNMSKITDPDNGLTGSPGTFSAALSVAFVDNDKNTMMYFTVGDKNIGYTDNGNPNTLARLLNTSGQADYDFVVIDGFGESAEEFAAAEGKIAVVSRGGGVAFTDKQQNAQDAGAVALIIYNNVAGALNMGINTGSDFIPCVSISNTDGAYLAEMGEGTLTISGESMSFQLPKTISDFSSWGPTPDLKLKPEIAGVGGNIYSTRDPEYVSSGYGYMSGTSMATPQISGAVAVLRQYLEEKYPDMSKKDLRVLEAQLLMSTADPITLNDLPVSPRAQGAGLANLVESTSTEAYLASTSNSENRPKGEFGDDPEKTGVYSFPFTVTNISDEAQTYTVGSDVLTETIAYDEYIANTAYGLASKVTVTANNADYLDYDFNGDGKVTTADARMLLRHVEGVEAIPDTNPCYGNLDVTSDGVVDEKDVSALTDLCAGKILVPAGKTVNLTAHIVLTDADKAYMNQFPNGIYVEGFVYLYNQDAEGVDLNMPFLGFYGDWSAAPVFDDVDNPSLYGRTVYTFNQTVLGTNPYIRSSSRTGEEYNTFSYANPLAELDFGMLRNAKKLSFTVTDSTDSSKQYFNFETDYATKSYYNSTYAFIFPFYIYNADETENYVWRGLDADGNQLPDGTKAIYTVNAWLDDGDDIVDDTWSFPVTLDSVKPQILNSDSLQDAVNINKETGEISLTLEMQDNTNLAAVLFVDEDNNLLGRYEVANEPGESVTETCNITGFGPDFTIVLADYACNELELSVSLELGEYAGKKPAPKALDSGRLYGSEASGLSTLEQGWFSIDKNDLTDLRNETGETTTYFSAEYVNGRIVAQRNNGDLVLLTPYSSYWETYTIEKSSKSEGQPGFVTYYDMALDYVGQDDGDYVSVDRLYAVGWTYAGDTDGDTKDDGINGLYRLDFYTNGYFSASTIAELTGLNDGQEIVTLACDDNGQLYGISTDAIFYKIDKATGECTEVRALTEFSGKPNYTGLNVVQSMCFDHEQDLIYWVAHSQTPTGGTYIDVCYVYTIDPATGEMTELGTYGPTAASALFIPTDMESDLINFTDAKATNVSLSPYETWLLEGRSMRMEAQWTPWNAQTHPITWDSSNKDVATVSASGYVTALSAGDTTISATTQIYDWEGNLVDTTVTSTVHVVASSDEIFGYIVTDDNNNANQFKWVTYSDQTPNTITHLSAPTTSVISDGEVVTSPALWQGGAYYDGYVYTVTMEQWTEDNLIYSGTSLYKTQVTKGATPAETVFGEPEKVGNTLDIEVGNLGFDYNTGRLYGVDLTHNGLCIVDRSTGSVDPLVEFYDPDGNFNTLMTAMTVICKGDDTIILCADMDGKLYTVNPDTGALSCVYQGNGQEYWYYAAMGYDYNTGNIYWNPSMDSGNNPLNLVVLQENEWEPGTYTAQVTDIGDVASKYGVEQVVIFTIPDDELEAKTIPVEGISITNGDSITNLAGAQVQLKTQTEPLHPTVQTRTWESSNPDVASVDKFGMITCKQPGTATITVELEGFTDTIDVTVLPSAGNLDAFVVSDQGGSGYFDFWLNVNDYAPSSIELADSKIGVYSMRTGAYFDGDYYVYDSVGNFLRINAEDHNQFTTLGTVSDVVSAMAYDYTTNTMYAVTPATQAYNSQTGNYDLVCGKLCTVDLSNGELTEVAQLDAPVFALAADNNGTLYGIGGMVFSDDTTIPTKLVTIDTATGACTEMTEYTDSLASMYICADPYMGSYRPQMTYDAATNRLYLAATGKELTPYGYYDNASYGLVMIQLGDNAAVTNLGKMALVIRDQAKVGMLFMGLLCAVPDASELPESEAIAVEINKDYAACVVNGQTQLRAEVKPSGVDQTVAWSTSDDQIATVDENGMVTGVAPGVVTITATQGDLSDTCQVTVAAATSGSVAYTVTPSEGLISFDPEAPYEYTVVDSTVNGNVVGMDISGDTMYYMVEDPDYQFPCIYRYDLNTGMNTFLGCIITSIVNYSDMAYDDVNDILYVTSGNYIEQYALSNLGTDPLLYTAEQLLPDTPQALTVVDGTLYVVVRENTVAEGTFTSLMVVDFNASGMKYHYVKRHLGVDTANNVCEMDYNPFTGTFIFSDGKNCLYSISLDGETIIPIDCVGDVLEIKGIAIGSTSTATEPDTGDDSDNGEANVTDETGAAGETSETEETVSTGETGKTDETGSTSETGETGSVEDTGDAENAG